MVLQGSKSRELENGLSICRWMGKDSLFIDVINSCRSTTA